jgi:hypothetical protein
VVTVLEELRGDPEGQEITDGEDFFQANIRDLLARPYEERLTEIGREMEIGTAEQRRVLLEEMMQVTALMRQRGLLRKSGILRSAQNARRQG